MLHGLLQNTALKLKVTTQAQMVKQTQLPTVLLLLLLLLLADIPRSCVVADPGLVQDYCVADTAAETWQNGLPCINPATVRAAHFQTSALTVPLNTSANTMGFSCAFAAAASGFPGLNTLGATLGRCESAPRSVTPLHLHPRGNQVVFVVAGALDWGFVDSGNRLFSGRAGAGDVFVVPQGLLHYAFNSGREPAQALFMFTSQNMDVSFVPAASFASQPSIPTLVLERSFAMDAATVAEIRRSLAGFHV